MVRQNILNTVRWILVEKLNSKKLQEQSYGYASSLRFDIMSVFSHLSNLKVLRC